tara:strand:+ start:2969 stop:3325 length:357 start_codon:yes stop_codon:yes gene_type:complete
MATEDHTVTSGEGALKAFERACTLSMRARNKGEISEELYEEINHTIAHLESRIRQDMEPKTIPVQVVLGCPSGSADWVGGLFELSFTDINKRGAKLSAEAQVDMFREALTEFMIARGA